MNGARGKWEVQEPVSETPLVGIVTTAIRRRTGYRRLRNGNYKT